MDKKYKVASLFSGCGGLDLGFINAGYEVIWANDFFKEAVETYKNNIGNHIVQGDITQIKSSEIPNDFDVLSNEDKQNSHLNGQQRDAST